MTTRSATFLLATLVFLGSVLHATVVAAEEFYSISYGYYLDLPAGWVEIPKDVLQEWRASVLKQNAKTNIIYDAAFQLASSDRWFEYPYVLVQPLPYATFGVHRQINEDEFSRYAQMMTGLDVDELLDEKLSSDARQLLGNLEFERPQLDVAHRRYLWPIRMDVQGVGPIRGLVVGYFGRDSVVQVAFYSRRSDWDRHADVRRTIVESFRFEPDKAYSVEVAAANPTPSSIWQRVLEKGLVGGITGGIIAAIIAGIAAMKRKKPAPTQDALEEDAR